MAIREQTRQPYVLRLDGPDLDRAGLRERHGRIEDLKAADRPVGANPIRLCCQDK